MAASEGINLISSTYFDDDDEMEDVEHRETPARDNDVRESEDPNNNHEDDSKNRKSDERVVDSANDDTPPISFEDSTPKPPQTTRPLTPQQQQQAPLSLLSPSPQQPVQSEPSRSRMGRLTIVDYGHDEAAMSPEAEEGEIVGTGVVSTSGAHLQTANGDIQEKTPPGTAQLLTPSTQATIPQLSEQLDVSEFHPMNNAVNESDSTGIEEAMTISVEESKDIDPLDRFLPPPPRAKCSDELQERINKFLYLKRLGKSYNAEVRNKKEYRNPDFLLDAMTYQGIDQIGSCFSKDVFDPHGYDKSDYYDEIEADMKRDMERKEQEKKKSQKVEFISGGSQPGGVALAPKLNIPIPGVSTVAAGGLLPVPSAVDSVTRDGRQNKKSKWDKVDVDRRNLLPSGGQDSASAAGVHPAFLSAANAGTGYTAFAQQRRREAEEKRSSERKMDRRS